MSTPQGQAKGQVRIVNAFPTTFTRPDADALERVASEFANDGLGLGSLDLMIKREPKLRAALRAVHEERQFEFLADRDQSVRPVLRKARELCRALDEALYASAAARTAALSVVQELTEQLHPGVSEAAIPLVRLARQRDRARAVKMVTGKGVRPTDLAGALKLTVYAWIRRRNPDMTKTRVSELTAAYITAQFSTLTDPTAERVRKQVSKRVATSARRRPGGRSK